jgi:hypothetical protein
MQKWPSEIGQGIISEILRSRSAEIAGSDIVRRTAARTLTNRQCQNPDTAQNRSEGQAPPHLQRGLRPNFGRNASRETKQDRTGVPSREPMLSSACWRLPCPLPDSSRFAQRVFSVAVPEDIFLQVELGVLKPLGVYASVPPAAAMIVVCRLAIWKGSRSRLRLRG